MASLHEAAKSGDVETMRVLLANGADPDERDANGTGRTALHEAVLHRHIAAVRNT